MAETAHMPVSSSNMVFRSRPQSIVAALALLIAGILTFSMGITRFFFVEAMAWTFTLWGALLMFNHLVDYTTSYEVTDDALIIRTPLRLWKVKRVWDWAHINRMDLVVERVEAEPEDVEMQVYYTPEGSTVLHREDIPFNREFAEIIAQRAGLKPKRGQAMQSFDQIPQDEKGTYTWQ